MNVGLAVGAAVLFMALALGQTLSEPIALALLAAFSAAAYFAEVRLKTFARDGFEGTGTFFNAGIVLAFVALVLAGPVPALLVWWIPDAISRIILRREPIFSPGHVATVSGYAAALVAGNELLTLRAAADGALGDMAVLYAAGFAMHAVDFAVTVLGFSPFYENQRPKALFRQEYLDVLPAYLITLGLAVITALLVASAGVLALVPLGVAILVPQLVLTQIVRERSASAPRRASSPPRPQASTRPRSPT